jgi:ABC-type glycerol-3-phosphate transport system substrate-binding protein
MDIATGRGADIIVLPPLISMDMFVMKGVLADLYPFIDDDVRMARADFKENILKAYETDDRLFAIPIRYNITTLTAAQSEVGDINGWNLDEIMDYVGSRLPDVKVFDNTSKTGVLEICLRANGDALVDWGNGESAFKRDLFIKMLHFANQFTPDEFFTHDWDIDGRIREQGQLTLLPNYASDFSFYYYQFCGQLFGEPVAFPGYPTEDKKGNLIQSNMVMAIGNQCRDKAVAWEFISSLLTKEFQVKQPKDLIGAFPILNEAFEELILEAMEVTYTVDENGVKIEEPKGSILLTHTFRAEFFAMTEEEIRKIREWIDSAEKTDVYDAQILAIVTEEAQAFFAGIVSAEQAADVAENRIRTYVNEMR